MNPFMMSNMFFGPMGMSVSPMCGFGVSMPYYGTSDMLTFMNFPIFRNTSSDYLLDPRLALMQGQQSMMNGGSLFGNTMLPMFNNFPGMNMPFPWMQPKTETEEEKKAREAREAEAKKPEAKKAASLKKAFDGIKKLADKNSSLVVLDESIIKKAEEAMKKEKAEDQLSAMKEVMALIPDDVIRKSVMADDTVVKKLKDAGYNFNYKNNKYSLPQTAVENIKMNQVYDNIVSKRNYDPQGLGSFAASAASGSPSILALVSAWNNSQSEKGILRFIGKNIPTEEGPLAALKGQIVPQIINAMIDKADQYSGCAKIKADRDKLAAAKDDLLKNFNQANLNKVSDAFEALYARLRMQEAVKIRDYIKNNADFNSLNEVKSDLINDDMVVAETYENLKEEGISNPPAEAGLDKIQTVSSVVVSDQGVVNKDDEYKNNPQGLVDNYLAKDNKFLTKIEGTDVYKTKGYDENGSGEKYYSVQDGKLIEVTKKEDGTFTASKDAKAVTSKEIEAYDSTIQRIQRLISSKSIVPVENSSNLFKATGAEEYYALIDGKFGKIKTSADSVKLDEMTAADLEDFNDADVKSKEKVEKDKKAKEEKEKSDKIAKIVKNVTAETYTFKTMKYQLGQLGLEETGVKGYYKTKAKPTLFFKYDNNQNSSTYQHLVYLKDVEEVSPDGRMKVKNSSVKRYCQEVQTSAESAKELYELLNNVDYQRDNYTKVKTEQQIKNDTNAMRRKLNTFISYTNVSDIINFISTYNDAAHHWWKRDDATFCSAIADIKALPESERKSYISQIAARVLLLVEKKGYSFDDKATLEHIAKGRLVTINGMQTGLTIGTTAAELDRIIEIVLKKYNEAPAEE